MTLIERLRNCFDHQPGCDGRCYELVHEAADRIEALQAALREIEQEPIPEQASLWVDAWKHLKKIARAALEGK